MPLGMEVGLGPRNIVLHADPAPTPQGAEPPQFSAHVCCGQTVGWIKMLGMNVFLSAGHIVLDGDPAPTPSKRGTAPNFRAISIVAKRLDGSRCHLVWR